MFHPKCFLGTGILGDYLEGRESKGFYRREKKTVFHNVLFSSLGVGAEREGLKAVVYFRSVDNLGT